MKAKKCFASWMSESKTMKYRPRIIDKVIEEYKTLYGAIWLKGPMVRKKHYVQKSKDHKLQSEENTIFK